ncbi:MAG: hypothetical protein HYT65_00205 [Candidatus Yanofskybacteria bacterium]|nr:hypothetical protein [Candidatus Yanofskybacteria bacterium]
MTSIFGFLMANWPYILAYPFVGFALGKITGKMYLDDTPTEELGIIKKCARLLFFPVRYHIWTRNIGERYTGDPEIRAEILGRGGEENLNRYISMSVFLWPLSLGHYTAGLCELFIIPAGKTCWALASLPQKIFQLLQSGSRHIKLLTPGNNLDIKTSISQIEEFMNTFRNTYLKSEKNKIIAEQKTLRDRLRVISESLENWQVIVRKNADTAAKIDPIIESLGKEKEILISKISDLHRLEEKLNAGEKNLSESLEILRRCLSTIPLGIPVYTDGPQLIKGDYVATLAAETISQAETEMSRIKNDMEESGRGGR